MYKRSLRLLSLFLTVVMLFNMLPAAAWAAEADTGSVVSASAQTGSKPGEIVEELPGKRTEYSKEFRLSNGLHMAAIYNDPVHYEENGQWKDIDNTLKLSGGGYTNTAGVWEVSFPQQLSKNNAVTITKDGYTLSFFMTGQLRRSGGLEVMSGGVQEEAVNANMAETEPAIAETEPTVAETEPAIAETEPVIAETEPTVAETEPAIAETEPAVAETEPAVAETEPVIAETEPAIAETEPTVAETEPAIAETEPAIAETEPTVAETEPAIAETEPVIAETEPAVAETEAVSPEAEAVPAETIAEVSQTLPVSPGVETLAIGGEMFTVQGSQISTAQVQQLDLTAEKAAAEHPETVLEKNSSRLQYESVYTNTDVVYDLVSNQVKESIVIGSYDAALRGYRYTLSTGAMIPVLTDSGEIHLYDEKQEKIVMVMPAPYLLDDAGEYCGDVTVNLSGANGTYTLTYTLPQSWMADKARQYPVVLDPVVEAGATTDNVSDVSLYENTPSAYSTKILDVGRNSSIGVMRALVKFLELPQIPSTDIIVDATFNLYHDPAEGLPTSICIHRVLEPWEESTVTWANQPDHDATIEDHLYAQAAGGEFYWDVTEIVRDWYDNGNNGLMLRATDAVESTTGSKSYRHQFYGETYSKYQIPSLTITYRSSIGIEPYYTYATLGVGNAGGVYLSDSTGQLTAVKEVASYASSVNPFSANLIYNSVYCIDDGATLYEPLKEMGLEMSFGAGWTLDVIQKIEPETIGETAYLKYTDGDGTVHYFQKKSGIYYDEDGLGLEIKVESDGSYTMSDSKDNKWYFTNIGDSYGYFMTSSEDNNKNKYEFTYSAGKLTTIVQKNKDQPAITVATLTYSGDNVSKITDAAGNSYNLTYSGDKLTQAYLGTNQCARYTYSDYRLTSITDGIRNYSLCFDYANGKVSSYYEQSGGTTGIRCDISRPSYTQTTYHDYGNDRQKNTADDLYTHYLFDYAGRTTNAYTTDSTGQNILGASTAMYTDNDGISKTNNRTLRTASIGVAAQKLLPRANFEDVANLWTFSSAIAATTNPRTGDRSLKGTLSSASSEATASRMSNYLYTGSTYTLSAYINTADLTSITGTGVYLKVTESNGTAYISESVDYITSEDIDEGWVRISLTFTATVTASATVSIHGTGAVGTFYVDDMQLEKGEAPSNYNMLENGDFQSDSTGYAWTLTDTASIAAGVGVNSSHPYAYSVKFENAIEDDGAIAYQTVNINESGAQTYVVSGWAKAEAVTDNVTTRSDPAYDHTKQFGIRATLTYTDGTKNYYYTPFNADVSTWQYASLTVIPESKTKKVDYITISCVYETNANVAYFDNLSMVREVVNSTEYDENGNPISAESTGTNGQTVSYDSNGNIKKIVTKTGTGSSDKITQTFTYDSTFVHRQVSSTDGTTTQTMTHDAVGNVASTTLKSAKISSGKVITSSSEYTNSGNLISSTTDSAGSVTSYNYSNALYKTYGIPSTITNAKGVSTSYTIDAFGRYQNIAVDSNSSLSYIYNNARLHEIQRTGGSSTQIYQFNYDGFDNVTSIGIGAHNSSSAITLMEYDYGVNNGLLTRQTYGNGDSVSFTYDSLGRTKTATYSDGRVLTYIYTGDGQLYSIQDSKTGYTYQYTYDSLGRLISSSVKDSSGDILTTQQTYDANNQLTGQSWQMDDTSYSQTFTYNKVTGNLTAMMPGNGHTISLEYDALQRVEKVDTGVYARYYTYRDISDAQTTTQVTELRYGTDTQTYFTYTYTYDELGNIATYSDGSNTYTYTYDSKGQLTRQSGGTTDYTYSYDAAGNRVAVVSDFTVFTYAYDDPVWTDRLTAYQQAPILYDASGNPISYYSGSRWTMEWEEGRNLVSAEAYNGTQVSYAYDQNGLRISKDVNGIAHEYLYASGTLLREVITGTDNTRQVLDFFYDQSGKPYALNHTTGGTTNTYYYITNLQGDVLHLITADGAVAASYTYDPYGKVLTSTGDIAAVNPLRYRGYYYDSETKFYYLQSRYYDPLHGRFINADSQFDQNAGFIGLNLFAYCANNPVALMDSSGKGIILALTLIGAGIGLVAGALVGDQAARSNGLTPDDEWEYYKYVVLGGTVGCAVGAGVGYLGGQAIASSWAYYKATTTIGTSAYAIGHAFEEWFYKAYNVVEQQVRHAGYRLDAILNHYIIELKNYDWSKYSNYTSIINSFTRQARNYLQFIGQTIGSQKIEGVKFFFSSRPPQEIIDALEALGVIVKWT